MKFICIIILLLKLTNVAAQGVDSLLGEELHFQVKQLDEFIQRFNYKLDVYGREIGATHPIPRSQYLLSLFDVNYLKDMNKEESTVIRQFVSQITDNASPQFLKFAGENIFAFAQCEATYEGKEKALQLILKIELAPNGAAKWVIYDVKASFLQPPLRTNNISLYIPPNSHETNFMSMRQELQRNKDQVTDYVRKDFQPDPMSIFLFEIANKRLKITGVSSQTYHILAFDGWVFTIDFFNRSGKNSGWLISKLSKMTTTKSEYIKSLVK